MEEKLMDIKQMANYLQMNKMTIYKLAREGKIPAFKVASEWRFKKDLIDQYLMAQLKGRSGLEKLKLEKKMQIGKTVLIVDDEEIIQDFFSRVLSDYNVLVASSGEEALEIIKKEKPNIILLDIKMPGIDGIETLRRIMEIDTNIAVIMLSAHGTLETNLEAARLGAYSSIAKPFDLKDIKTAINNALISTAAEGGTKSKSIAKTKKHK